MPRKAWLVPLLIVVALVVQLTVLNRLHLPGGGVPDLALVLVAAFAMADGPIYGMILGFGTGLCLDLAPPASQFVGQYALVFCLAGWAAGRLSPAASKSAARAVVLVACVVAAAEALAAGLGLVLEPAEVTWSEVRVVLPATIGYDLLLCPFLVYFVMLISTASEGGLAGRPLASLMTVATRGQRAEDRRRRPLERRLGQATAGHGDRWLAGAPARSHGAPRATPGRAARLRPSRGVAGSAAGFVRGVRRPVTPVHLRLTAPRRGDGTIGSAAGRGQLGRGGQLRRHPGQVTARREFRPHGGELGGSASAPGLARPVRGRPGGPATVRFGGHRGDASVGRTFGGVATGGARRPAGRTPRLRVGMSRSALTRRRPAPQLPSLHFGGEHSAVARRAPSMPKFRRRSSLLHSSATASGLVSGAATEHGLLRARRQRPVAGLRLSRRRPGMIGGSGTGPRRIRTSVGGAKRPNFGYGRRSPLSYLTGKRIGGRWLASKRVGARSGIWLIGKGTGGLR